MWTDNFWTDNFWAGNFWVENTTQLVYNIVLIDGSTKFVITVDSDTDIPQGTISGTFVTPTQNSYGGIIRLAHNFPFISGDIASIGYESPNGEFGELPAYSFDGTYVKAYIPEGLLDIEGKYWKFNIKAMGTRNSVPFSIRSSPLRLRVLDGLVNESI